MALNVEQIDERILKLLRLEDEFEMSYEEYLRHLRTALVEAQMVKSKFSSEEALLLQDERKRVKGKKGRFQIKKKKVTTSQRKKPTKDSIRKLLNPSGSSVKPNANVAKEQVKQTKTTESILDIVISIRESVSKIYESVRLQNKLTTQTIERDRKNKENQKRKKREEDLESSLKKVGNAVSKILSPIQGILDKIFRFIAFTILGQALGSLFEWLKDPENRKKFNSLIRFFTDRWKFFVGAFILFGTSFGSFVRGMLKTVAKGLIALAFHIPRIKRFLKRNPKLAMLGISAATLGTGLLANTLNPPESKGVGDDLRDVGKDDFDQAKSNAEKSSNVKIPTLKMGGMIPNISLNVGGSYLGSDKKSNKMNIIDGIVGDRGTPFTGGGKDNRLFPTATGGAVGLSGNEFIVNEGGVTKETLPILMAFNRMGAGANANKPKMISSTNIKVGGAFNGGSLNIRKFQGGGSTNSNVKIGGLSGGGSIVGFTNGGLMNSSSSGTTNRSNKTNKTNRTKTSTNKSNQNTGIQNLLRNIGNTGRSIINNVLPGRRPAGATQSQPPSTKVVQPIPEHKTPEVQSLLRTIKVAEGTAKSANSYDTLFGFGSAPIRQMTVAEVISMQNTDRLPKRLGGGAVGFGKDSNGKVRSAASGAYQFMPWTLQQIMNMGVLKPSDVMTPDNQDKAAWALASKYRGITLQDLRRDGLSRSSMNKIAPEWASIPTHSGQSYYGQPVKEATLLQRVYNEHLKKITEPPGPPVRGRISSITLPPQVIDNTKQQVASSISNKGDPDMVANIFPSESNNKGKLLGLV
jgi:lysozyme